MKTKIFYCSFLIVGLLTSCSKNDSTPVTPTVTAYFPQVKSIISSNCMSCHNSTAGLEWTGRPTKFDTDTDITTNYAAIKASVNDPVSPTNRRMPQTGTLSASDIDIIVKWYNKGGKSTD